MNIRREDHIEITLTAADLIRMLRIVHPDEWIFQRMTMPSSLAEVKNRIDMKLVNQGAVLLSYKAPIGTDGGYRNV